MIDQSQAQQLIGRQLRTRDGDKIGTIGQVYIDDQNGLEQARFAARDQVGQLVRVDVTVPAGTMDDERRAGLVKEVTELVLAAAGLGADQALRVWVLLHEQPDGTWGAGGRIMRLADIAGMASN